MELENLNVKKYWKVPDKLGACIWTFGVTGSGKSFCNVSLAQSFFNKGYKIYDVFGGARNEGGFWCFPTDEAKIWSQYFSNIDNVIGKAPKEYNVNLLIPCFSKKLPKQLPNLPPRVKAKIFTIPLHEITLEEIGLAINNIPEKAKYLWNQILENTNKNSNGADISNLMDTDLKKYKSLHMYLNFLKPLIDNNLIGSDNSDLRLNLIEESKDKQTISVLLHEFIPEQFRFFIMGWLMKRLWDLANTDKIGKKNITLFREMSHFMKIDDDSSQGAEQRKAFRNLMAKNARYARSGVFTFGDSQSPNEVKVLLDLGADMLVIKEMPSQSDRDALCKPLKHDRRINNAQIAYLSKMEPREAVIVERREKAQLIKFIQPPRTMMWKEGGPSFLNTWKKMYNSYTNTSHQLDVIFGEYEKRREIVGEEDKVEKQKDSSKEEKQIERNNKIEEKENKIMEIPQELIDNLYQFSVKNNNTITEEEIKESKPQDDEEIQIKEKKKELVKKEITKEIDMDLLEGM